MVAWKPLNPESGTGAAEGAGDRCHPRAVHPGEGAFCYCFAQVATESIRELLHHVELGGGVLARSSTDVAPSPAASGYDGPSYQYDGLPPATAVRRISTTVCLQLRRFVVSVRRSASSYGGSSYQYDGLPPATTVRRIGTTVCLQLRRSVVLVRRSASGYDGSSYRYDSLPPATTVRRIGTTVCLQLRRFVVSVRRSASGCDGPSYRYGGLPPAATVRRIGTTVCLQLRRSVVSVRRSASGYDNPSYRYAVCLQLRRSVVSVRRSASGYDDPSYRYGGLASNCGSPSYSALDLSPAHSPKCLCKPRATKDLSEEARFYVLLEAWDENFATFPRRAPLVEVTCRTLQGRLLLRSSREEIPTRASLSGASRRRCRSSAGRTRQPRQTLIGYLGSRPSPAEGKEKVYPEGRFGVNFRKPLS